MAAGNRIIFNGGDALGKDKLGDAGAAHESAGTDGGHTFGDDRVSKGVVIAEGIRSNDLNAAVLGDPGVTKAADQCFGGAADEAVSVHVVLRIIFVNGDALQAAAQVDDRITDLGHTGGDLQGGQCGAVHKRTGPDAFQAVGKVDTLKARAAAESIDADGGNTVRDRDLRQRPAAVEGLFRDLGQTRRQPDLLHMGRDKCFGTDVRDAVGQQNAINSAAGESIGTDGGHTFGDLQRLQLYICKDGITDGGDAAVCRQSKAFHYIHKGLGIGLDQAVIHSLEVGMIRRNGQTGKITLADLRNCAWERNSAAMERVLTDTDQAFVQHGSLIGHGKASQVRHTGGDDKL